jgi:hypothetical protein
LAGTNRAAADQPQQAYTTKTPRQVVRESRGARLKLMIAYTLLILACLAAIIWVANQEGWLPLGE